MKSYFTAGGNKCQSRFVVAKFTQRSANRSREISALEPRPPSPTTNPPTQIQILRLVCSSPYHQSVNTSSSWTAIDLLQSSQCTHAKLVFDATPPNPPTTPRHTPNQAFQALRYTSSPAERRGYARRAGDPGKLQVDGSGL